MVVGEVPKAEKGAWTTAIFSLTLFVSAALLFLVEPMIAKMILPRFGGSAGVWTTCMVFFQTTLLIGYAYAHFATAYLAFRRQALVHGGLILLGLALAPLVILPVTAGRTWEPPGESNPIPWLLGLLLIIGGIPFFVLSTTAPLLQRWFSHVNPAYGKDPYYLYAASNAGSLLALFAYPFLLEPHLHLVEQGWFWVAGYGVLAAFILACAVICWRSPPVSFGNAPAGFTEDNSGWGPWGDSLKPRKEQCFLWVLWSFVPSSLLLSTTTYMTTDIAPIPFLWVLPLALYLLSFIVVFSRLPRVFLKTAAVLTVPVILLLIFVMETPFANQWRITFVILVHLTSFFLIALVLHGRIAETRPPAQHLTEFFFYMSLGGVLGGFFNAIVAPLMFSTLAEYPLVVLLACVLRPTRQRKSSPFQSGLDFGIPLLLGITTLWLIAYWQSGGSPRLSEKVHDFLINLSVRLRIPEARPERRTVRVFLEIGPPLVMVLLFARRPVRFGLGLGAIFAASTYYAHSAGNLLYQERSFFGTLSIAKVSGIIDYDKMEKGQFHQLSHGTTFHGIQRLTSEGKPGHSHEPLSYYHPRGPIGQVFEYFQGKRAKKHVGVIGLGTGTLAAFGHRGERFTFFEIDPAVERIARNPTYFTYLRDSWADIDVLLGDARLTLRRQPSQSLGLLVVDAFSSDAIPIHLITREALQLYFDKLEKDGILAFHISNRYVNLEPVLAQLARELGLEGCLVQHDNERESVMRAGACWVLLSRHLQDLGELALEGPWTERTIERNSRVGVWTDDFSNVLGVFEWKN